jgi:L-threonylcarbamoyladenylate synthase
MDVENLKVDVDKAKKIIEDGGVVVFPTETAYGLAADALDPDAVEKVYEAKQRPRSKGLTAIVDSIEQAERHAELSESERNIVEELMPGPITLVADKSENSIPEKMNEKFVFRISSSELARSLAENPPITATSANISGESTSYSIDDISEELLEKVDGVIDEGELSQGPTSTIVEVNNSEIIIHRKGPVSRSDIEEVLD